MTRWPWRNPWLLAVVAIVLIVSVLSVTIVFLDKPQIGIQVPEKRAEVVRNLGLIIGGILALGIAIWRSKVAEDQVKVNEGDRLDRRFHNAVSQLSHQEVVSRLAGIRMLGQLAETDPATFRDDVVQVLCAFARNPTAVDKSDSRPLVPLPSFLDRDAEQAAENLGRREEIEGAVKVVSACNAAAKSERNARRLTIDLAGIALPEANFDGVDLSGAILTGAQLSRASLERANLSNADLRFADLRRTDMTRVNLADAQMAFADLGQANLDRANLARAQMQNAQMSNARFHITNCSATSFSLGQDESHSSDLLARQIDETAASGLTQRMVRNMWAEDRNPPKLKGIRDSETDDPLEWSSDLSYARWLSRWPPDD